MPKKSLLLELRSDYHKKICLNILGHKPGLEVFSVADKGSPTSVALAAGMAKRMAHPTCTNPKSGQTAGSLFSQFTLEFLEAAFRKMAHLRPGNWLFSATQAATGISAFDQYEHLADLSRLLVKHKKLSAALGGDYLITPDIIVARRSVSDPEINEGNYLIDPNEKISQYTPLRTANFDGPRAILHASISCKWTMRSDRSQNTRTEALNLIRNRKGQVPHIVAVTLEPMPTRLASIAMGTGDVDCTYHSALYELKEAVDESGNSDQAEMLDTLISGRRLRDISDLPFDLAI